MQIDTIKKRDSDSNGVIDLKPKKNKTFKINSFRMILKNKKDFVFYLFLFLIMGVIVFFWFLNFKKNIESISKTSAEDSLKYQEFKNSINILKKDLGSSVDAIKTNIKELDAKKDNNTNTDNKSDKTTNDSNQQQILDSLTEEQKKQILDKTLEEVVPQEFSQEDLKVRLDLLNK